MNKLFDSYWALRITALVLALLLFFYAKAQMDVGQTSTTNPQMDIITDVPLEAYYDKENLIVSGLPETVDVTIEGPMQIVLKTKLAKDFTVFVDLNQLLIGEHRVEIKHENFSDKLDVSIDPKVLDIVIEEKVTEEVKVEPELNNQMIAEGYELVGMSAEPSTVLVTGAKSIIDSISYVKATINGEDEINESFKKEATVKVLDNNLNKLDVLIEPATVDISIDVRPYSKEIPIVLRQKGKPKDGVVISSLVAQTKQVEVFGPKSVIDPLTRLEVEFDISDIDESGTYKVKVPLPNGAFKQSPETIEVQAQVIKTATEPEADSDAEEEPVEETKPANSPVSNSKPSSDKSPVKNSKPNSDTKTDSGSESPQPEAGEPKVEEPAPQEEKQAEEEEIPVEEEKTLQ
ncbi:hypothetical protein D1B33_13380 [Lysinibacillus yapensis]|uniref:YbbR-like domain-containing protein n=1 Tax=Ureibacillus yapensis TaxID=2304605 RepID=A0A396S5I2_9BACL|nr:CdaR family protein [Lysinibacillus yapensis]RHW35029.1 hypothetical protein D1B33_13380 [Lysinibacillus yapensis]